MSYKLDSKATAKATRSLHIMENLTPRKLSPNWIRTHARCMRGAHTFSAPQQWTVGHHLVGLCEIEYVQAILIFSRVMMYLILGLPFVHGVNINK